MAEESHKTFFSYARADSEFVLRLVKDLRAAGADVWLDQLDIGPGKHWDTEVEKALRLCPRHLTVLSPAAVNSQNVMDEISFVLDERKEIIPLLYQDCTVPFRLRRLQWVDFRTDYASGFRELTQALGIKDAQSVPAPQVVPMKEAPAVPAPPVKPIEATQRPSEPGIQAEADDQAAPVVEQPPREVGTGEAPSQKGGGRKVEQTGAAASEPRIWPDAKVLWITGVVVVALALGIWMISSGKTQHGSGAGQEITVTPTPDNSQAAASDAKSFVLYLRGNELFKQKQYDQAIEAFTQAIQLNSGNEIAYGYRGLAYYYENKYNLAIQDYTQASKLNPNEAIYYYNRGLAYSGEKNYDLAIQDYSQALKLNPNEAIYYYNRGNAYYLKGDYDRAIQSYTQALKLNPNYALACNYRGAAYERKKQYEQALQDFDCALKIDPNMKIAQIYRDRVAAKLQK